MTFAKPLYEKRNIAVIGAGITGLGAAYELSKHHSVTLFEAENRLGGHARTVVAGKRSDQPVDTGFIVFNYVNYPNMVKLFEELDVPVTLSNMSFGASVDGGRIEYALRSLDAMIAQRKNAFNPKFLRMIADILKFNSQGLSVAQDRSLTIGGFLDRLGTGEWFRDYYLLPLSGAIWSTPTEKIMEFPAYAMLQFFENHALLRSTGQHQWYTVNGGSREYVSRVEQALHKQDVTIRLGAAIEWIKRTETGVLVKSPGHVPQPFDDVVLATHSDDSLKMLADPTPAETAALGAIRYQPNDIILHCDETVMPARKKCWASWVYTERADKVNDRIDLTYWMNSLQPIPMDDPMFVTLNTTHPIKQELIYDQVTLRHPVYDLEALDGQAAVAALNGQNNTWFCGAWMKNGFHEDGLSSGLDVASGIMARESLATAAE